ncbi:uncharacterized protein LOC128387256 [Panonychus citri]|uniref:uncharacterized protein LOC128387256 n=1 Tax=Panonychus citri TaxID=50023 RepID=UPI00230820CE|nr:uncharacterized protein LOC128387256 [Panonychus citri]
MERVNVSQILPNLKFLTKGYTRGTTCTCRMLVNVLSTSKPLVRGSTRTSTFQFLSLFPDLRSIFLNIRCIRNEDEVFSVSDIHLNIQDCVLRIIVTCELPRIKLIKSVMVEFPNCCFIHPK